MFKRGSGVQNSKLAMSPIFYNHGPSWPILNFERPTPEHHGFYSISPMIVTRFVPNLPCVPPGVRFKNSDSQISFEGLSVGNRTRHPARREYFLP